MNSKEPKIIYLQIGEENTTEDFSDEKEYLDGSVSWCVHNIYESDIKYISKDYLLLLIDEMIAENKKYFERGICWLCYESDYCTHEKKIEALTELKEKIEGIEK